MSPQPTYLKQRGKGDRKVFYVTMRVPTSAQHVWGLIRNESLRTSDLSQALRDRHKVIARFQADFEEAARAPLPADAASLMPLAEQVRAGEMSENDFDGQLSSYLDALPRDEYGQPVIGSKDLTFVRKASAVASGVQLLESLSEQWLALEATKGIKQATVAERRGHLNKLLKYLGDDARPTDLTKARAVGFVEEALNPLPVGKSRKQFMLATCRGFADWLEVRGMIPTSDPFGKVGMLLRAADTSRDERSTWSPEDLLKMLQAIPHGDPMWPLVAICAYTAARPQELCNVRCEDVTETTLTIKRSKTQAGERTIPIPPQLRDLVSRLAGESSDGWLLSGLTTSTPDDNRFKLIGKRLQTVRKRVGLHQTLQVYSLRHTGITLMTEAGHPEWLRQLIVGHEGGSTIMAKHYVKSKNMELMAEAMNAITYGVAVDKYVMDFGNGKGLVRQHA
ncbi:tyrosine-type recombinase/integrase [Stenotrophomonas aracearum]|uniref:Tyrosine-type recombinase/integrase n=1 Tax=Stenotrophomonas aracearum TaxID=3003272 RepID=A0ABY9Y8V0_9GAMM|nr:tyrosine-type recombinase/integrase [Stenotrophomonas sp. A5588]WNH47241.1 tyrosine-type recombinase/integrase [Stenotrophomonas sp. A5588]